MTCSGGSAAAPASLPRREQRKAGGGGPPSSPVRYNGITSVKEQRANRPVRVSRARKVSAQAGASDKNRTQTDNGSQFLPRRCPFSASSPTLSSATTAVPNGQSRAQEARAAPLFCHLRQAGSPGEAARGEFWGRNLGLPFSGAGVPLREPSQPFRGMGSRSGEWMVGSVGERTRSAEQGACSAEASRVLWNGSPVPRNGSLVSLVL